MNEHLWRHQKQLMIEGVSAAQLITEYGSPLYVYSQKKLEENWHAFTKEKQTTDLICYAVKANANLSILRLLANLGAGFDIVSGGELACVLRAGGQPEKIVFSGVGKTEIEIRTALEAGILSLHVESVQELARIAQVAQDLQMVAPVAIRVNPDVDSKTHPYISTGLSHSKFGIDVDEAFICYQKIQENAWLKPVGLACHIGSNIFQMDPFFDAVDKLLAIIERLQQVGINLCYLDVGGGLGVCYQDEIPPCPSDYVRQISDRIAHTKLNLIFEPGRALLSDTALLLTRVEYLKTAKDKQYAIVDAGMNDFIRPALYQAYCDLIPVQLRADIPKQNYCIVGPVCESADIFATESLVIHAGDALAFTGVGAYGFSMTSNYNARLRPAEVMVYGDQVRLIRQRQQVTALWQDELDFCGESQNGDH